MTTRLRRRCFSTATAVGLWAGVLCGAAVAAEVPPASAPATAASHALPGQTFSVIDFGAIGDGKTMNTDALCKAIDACAAAGGGRVYLPAGTYVTGPVQLKSSIDLHLADGAVLQFSRNVQDYPLAATEYEGRSTVQARSPIWGENLRDVSITGGGAIDGSGDIWRPLKKSKVTPEYWDKVIKSGGVLDATGKTWWPSRAAMEGQAAFQKLREGNGAGSPARVEDYATFRELLRPPLILLSGCRNVVFDGPTFRNSPNWNINLNLCENVTLRNLTVFNPSFAQNGDGIDLGSCRNVLVSDCTVDVGDDGICLKSGRDEEGRRRGRPTENVTVRNCTVLHGHGGVVIGSEMSGGVRNVSVTNCVFRDTETGLRFKTARGRGGVVENIEISNIAMSNIAGEAITFDMFYATKSPRPEPVSERTPVFRQFLIRNVTCDGAGQAMEVRGLPEMPIADITFDRLRISAAEGASIVDAENIVLRDVRIQSQKGPPLQVQNVKNLSVDRLDGTLVEGAAAPATQPIAESKDERNARTR